MRELCAIVADAKDGIVPTHEECFWAMLALSGKLHFENRTLIELAKTMEKGDEKKLMFSAKIRLTSEIKVRENHHAFIKMEPTKWLGDSGNPFTEESKAWMDMGKKIIEKATGKKL